MVAVFNRPIKSASFLGLLLVVLSISALVGGPSSFQRTALAGQNQAGLQKPDASHEMTAAIDSLKSGTTPFAASRMTCSPSGLGASYCETSLSNVGNSISNPGWTQILASPSSRLLASLAYDAADGYTVLFGGLSAKAGSAQLLSDTWKFAGGSWTNITGTSPSRPSAASMAYDAGDGYLVLFTSPDGTAGHANTWKFVSGAWTNITTSTGPSARNFAPASMAYDAADNYVVLFGGACNSCGSSSVFHDTWKFKAGVWTNITAAAGPSPRFAASITYDSLDNHIVLFGGCCSNFVNSASYLGDTWKFTNGIWTNITATTHPSARVAAGLAYDAADGFTVLFGGTDSSHPGLGDTWKFSTGVWRNITTAAHPPPRGAPSIAYDAADGYLLSFGGAYQAFSSGTTSVGDTWKFLSDVWTEITAGAGPPPQGAASMAYDAKNGYVVLFGGGTTYGLSSNTWKFSAGVWTNITTTSDPPARAFATVAYDDADGYLLLYGGQGFGRLLGDTWKFSAGSWTNITSSSGPSPRTVGAMTFDAVDNYVVLFGGCKLVSSSTGGCLNLLGDTWKFQAGVWTNITSVGGPSRRLGMSVTYDGVDGYVLLFGGAEAANIPADTWKFKSGVWTNITSVVGPSRRAGASLVYDAADGYCVLFGGDNFSGTLSGSLLGDTWKFSAGAWTNITSSIGPLARFGGSMAFDGADGYVVLFGGQDKTGNFIGQTWKFGRAISSPSPWTNITTAGPGIRTSFGLAFDGADGYVVLFGGNNLLPNHTSQTVGDTWKFSAGIWTNITTSSGPPARFDFGVAYDSVDGYVVLYGGEAYTSQGPLLYFSDTWKFSSGVWTDITSNTSPGIRTSFTMAYDGTDSYLVLFGGNTQLPNHTSQTMRDTWKFSSGAWTNITQASGPGPRFGFSMAFDGADGYVVLYGGEAYTSQGPILYFSDTWKFSAGAWTNIASAGPGVRTSSPMAFDGADGYVVLFGGNNLLPNHTSQTVGDTWKFSAGVWTNITSGLSPPPRFESGLAFDAADGYTVLYGGYAYTSQGPFQFFSDTWKFSLFIPTPSHWTNITPSTSPPQRYGASLVYDGADGYVLLFGGQKTPNQSGLLGDTWKFSGGVWTNITSSGGPSPRYEPSMAYDAADGYVLLFGGSGSLNGICCYRLGDTWKFLAGSWTKITAAVSPSARDGASIAYDAADGYVILFGGTLTSGSCCVGDTWKFSGGTWTSSTPASNPVPRRGASMAYDTADGYVTLFGGIGVSGFLADTWTFLGGSWTDITTSNSPSARYFASMADDVADGQVLLFGGADSHAAILGDTWKLVGGSWMNITSSIGPSTRYLSSMTYDSGDGYVILLGGQLSNGAALGDTWKFSGGGTPPAFDFILTGPGSVTLEQGTTTIAMPVVATLTSGSTSLVTFSISSALPSGVAAAFGSNPCSPTCTATISFTASATATLGSSTIVLHATGGGATKTVNIPLMIIPGFDFSLSTPTPPSLSVTQGSSSATTSITATMVSGSPSPVVFLVTSTSLPAGITPNFTNDPCTPTCTVTLSFTAANSAQPGSYTLTILASGRSPPHTVQISLTVLPQPIPFSYSLSVNPPSASIVAGSSASATVTAVLTSGAGQLIALQVTVSPAPMACVSSNANPCGTLIFSPTTVTPTQQGATSTLTISTTVVVPPGTYALTITGTPAGSPSSPATFTLTVTAPSVSTVGCGHDVSCSVLSNATLSKVRFAGNTIHVEADGPSGAHGYANVTVPKSSIPHIEQLNVFVDNNKLAGSEVTITSNSTAYFIYFTFTFHSPVLIDIQLTAPEQTPNAPMILGLDPTLFFVIIGAVIAVIIIASAAVAVRRRGRPKPTI